MNYTFDIDDATKYGVDEAIMLSNLKFWLRKNKVNERHNHDGHTWTYNSKKGFAELFPFWSPRQIERIINSLKKQGLIITGNYNKMKFDHTLWYAFVDEKLLELPITPNGAKDETKQCKGVVQTVEPIPDSKPNKENNNKAFDAFWIDYPCKQNKQAALKAFTRLSVANQKKAHSLLNDFINGLPDFQRKDYRLHASTYLNGKRWEDETAESGNDYLSGVTL